MTMERKIRAGASILTIESGLRYPAVTDTCKCENLPVISRVKAWHSAPNMVSGCVCHLVEAHSLSCSSLKISDF